MLCRQTRLKLLLAALMLSLASLACWSSDTWIIPPTPSPTLTPVPPTPDFDSLYTVGDSVTIVTDGIAPLYLTERPEPPKRSNRVANAACYAEMVVTILAVERVDDVIYYQITCNNLPGWASEALLNKGQ